MFAVHLRISRTEMLDLSVPQIIDYADYFVETGGGQDGGQ